MQSTPLRPALPESTVKLIKQLYNEEGVISFQELEWHQMREIMSEISYDKACFAYTAEFGLLSDVISDIFAGSYKDEKSYGIIEECFIECWLEQINEAFKEAADTYVDETEFNPESYHSMEDGFIANYEDKHGE